MFIIHIYNKQLVSRIPYKSIVTIDNLIEKWARGLNRHFTKEKVRSCYKKITSDFGKVVLVV